jgi:uncharacterized OsmC-like protein
MFQADCTMGPSGSFQVHVGLGVHSFFSDQPFSQGGMSTGPAPEELLLAAIGTSMVQAVMAAAMQEKWSIDSLVMRVTLSEIADPSDAGALIEGLEGVLEVTGNVSEAEMVAIERTISQARVSKLIDRLGPVTLRAATV